MNCTGRDCVSFTGIRTPKLARMCCRWLSVTWNCGTTSQFVFALRRPIHGRPVHSTIGDHNRPIALVPRIVSCPRRSPEDRLRNVPRVCRRSNPVWNCRKLFFGSNWPYAANPSKHRDPRCPIPSTVARRQNYLARQTEDRTRPQAAGEQSLVAQRQIPHPAEPRPPDTSCRNPNGRFISIWFARPNRRS